LNYFIMQLVSLGEDYYNTAQSSMLSIAPLADREHDACLRFSSIFLTHRMHWTGGELLLLVSEACVPSTFLSGTLPIEGVSLFSVTYHWLMAVPMNYVNLSDGEYSCTTCSLTSGSMTSGLFRMWVSRSNAQIIFAG